MEGVVDPAPADVGWSEALGQIIAASRLDIVHHQIKGRRDAGFDGLLRLSDDDMRAPAKLQDGELGVFKNRAQADGYEPPRRSRDICRRKPDVSHRHWRPLLNGLRHDFPVCLSSVYCCLSGQHLEQVAVRVTKIEPAAAMAVVD